SAAQASELIPLPTTIASRSAAGELTELLVGNEPALARAQRLHLREHLGPALLREVEPELLGLDPDRVEPALLAEPDPALGRDQVGGVGLDRGRVVELARDRAALAPEEGLARDRLPRLELVAGKLAHPLGDLADAVEPEVRLDAVERPQGQRHLAEVRVARALAHAVDRP